MPELFDVLPPKEALQVFRRHVTLHLEPERVPTEQALDRFLAEELTAPEELPAFPRSSMDGFSVRAEDTFGASEGLPAYLTVIGEVPMGLPTPVKIGVGETAICYTGGMLADEADAVVMVEYTQEVGRNSIEVLRPVAPGENVIQPGEDVHNGQSLFPKGHALRPQDIGGLLALGIIEIAVTRRSKVAILSTGNELVNPNDTPGPGQVRDINSYTVASLVQRCGGIPMPIGIVRDEYEVLLETARNALAKADILVFSAGSSTSTHDLTAAVINTLGEPGVLVHGVSLRPGKPTILAVVDGKPAIGLPGNPVSAMVVFNLFVAPLLSWISGLEHSPHHYVVQAKLKQNIASAPGREDHVPVRLAYEGGDVYAEPLFGKSNLIYTLVRADGTVKIPLDVGGLYEGEMVQVTVH